jgi:hypothetical protein
MHDAKQAGGKSQSHGVEAGVIMIECRREENRYGGFRLYFRAK